MKKEASTEMSGLFAMYGGRMNKVQRNAKAYSKLLDVEQKMDHLYLLEEFVDNNDIVFNFIKHKIQGSSIQAKIFLYKDMSGKDIYLFLDSTNDDEYYYPRSFVVAPELDYKAGQFKYTVLWKEKRNRLTGESEILYRFKDFNPEKQSA